MLLDERLFEDYIDCEKTPKGKKSKAGFAGDPTANMTRDEYIDWLITVKGYNKKSAESTANMFYESLKEDSDTKEDLISTLSNKFWYISKLANNSASGIINYPEEFAKCGQRVSRMSRELEDIIHYMQKLGDDSLSESLKEDFDDVVDIVLPNSDEEIVIPTAPEVATIPTGPKTGEEIGQSSMLLDAIAACAKTIDNYNIIKTNLTDPKMIEVVEGIASQETNILGKLQGLLKEVSPNASEIMYGATDAEAALTESLEEDKELTNTLYDFIGDLIESYGVTAVVRAIKSIFPNLDWSLGESLNEDFDMNTLKNYAKSCVELVAEYCEKNAYSDSQVARGLRLFSEYVKDEVNNKRINNESLDEDFESTNHIEIIEDGEEAPYLHGYSEEDVDIYDRNDLSEEELWATGWGGIVQKLEDAPFKTFEDMYIACFDDEKGGEYNLPKVPEDIQKEFVKKVNKWMQENSDNLDEAVIPNSSNLTCPKCGSNNYLEIDDDSYDDFATFHFECQDCGYISDTDEYSYDDSHFDSSYLEHLDPMTGKLKVEAWNPPVEQSDVNDMATANMPDMIIPDDLDVDDDFEDPEEI